MTDDISSARLFEIAEVMKDSGLSADFVGDAVYFGLENEDIASVMVDWSESSSDSERRSALSKLQRLVAEASTEDQAHDGFMSVDELSDTSDDVMQFKAHLRKYVDARGGLEALSEQTDISIDALLDFFVSEAPPHPEMLSTIAEALDLDQAQLVEELTESED